MQTGPTALHADACLQASTVSIPQRLNNVPHQRETRQFFYQDACAAVKKAVAAQQQLQSVR